MSGGGSGGRATWTVNIWHAVYSPHISLMLPVSFSFLYITMTWAAISSFKKRKTLKWKKINLLNSLVSRRACWTCTSKRVLRNQGVISQECFTEGLYYSNKVHVYANLNGHWSHELGKHVSVFTALTAGCSVERDVSTPVTIHNNRWWDSGRGLEVSEAR